MRPPVIQPGPPAGQRIESVTGRLRELSFTAEPGLPLVRALGGPMAAAGLRGGAVSLVGLRLAPFRYVIPARSPDADHVAFYSDTFSPDGEVLVEEGTATFGWRDGQPFLHAHALWRDASGGQAAGHVLPLDTELAAPHPARAWGIAEGEMLAAPDPETNFTLFGPVRRDAPKPGAETGVLARLRPGEDLVGGIETLCRRHGATRATVLSGIGSTVGCVLEAGGGVDTVPTEFLVRTGTVRPDAAGQPRAEIEIVLVDEAATILRGRPTRGLNPVLICAEIVLALG